MEPSNGSKYSAQNESDQQMENEQKQQLLQTYLPHSSQHIDVRMKRHPELQPYVPSDRDRVLSGNSRRPVQVGGNSATNGGGSSMNRANLNHRLAVSKTTKSQNNANATTTTTNDPKIAKSKKCVSMTRLDQLAQPKKIFPRNSNQSTTPSVPSTSLTSSNTTSTTTSSLTSNKNYHHPPKTAPQANRLSLTRQPKPATPREVRTSIITKSSTNGETRRASVDAVPRKSIDSRSSFASAIEEGASRLKINGDSFLKQENDSNQFGVEEADESRTISDEQDTFMSIRQDDDSRIVEAAEEARLKQEKERRLWEEEEARVRADEEARLKADEELREKARFDEEERQKRQLIVENILSKFTPSS